MADDNISYGPIYGIPCIVVGCYELARMSHYNWGYPLTKQGKHDFCVQHGDIIKDLFYTHNRISMENRHKADREAFDNTVAFDEKLNKFFLTGKLEE